MRGLMLLIAANILVFTAASGPTTPWTMRASEVLDGSVWQLWTSTFLHLDLSHLVKNMVTLLVFGVVAARAGIRWIVPMYTACGLAAGGAYILLSTIGFTNPYSVCLGSSGCILGLVAAVPMLRPDIRLWLGLVSPPLWAGSLAFAAWYAWSVWSGDRGSDVFHLAGMVAGAGLATAIRLSRKGPPSGRPPPFAGI